MFSSTRDEQNTVQLTFFRCCFLDELTPVQLDHFEQSNTCWNDFRKLYVSLELEVSIPPDWDK